ncbi:MAG TPA: M56 family metallopeptidase [Solirubrobacteraceae bacterium]|nr:M56 family metallopeptidase [Solirubrobacteraceae bacterium]
MSTESRWISRTGIALTALGLGSALFVILRLIETWRVTPAAASHEVTVLGQRLSYPTANLAAVVVVVLAAVGFAVVALAAYGAAREVLAARRFARRVTALAWPLAGGVYVIADGAPRAFCAGLVHPRVYVSDGTLAALDDDALRAVLDHERHHARRRDPLRLAAGRVAAQALFFVPGLRRLASRQEELAELNADASAIGSDETGRQAMARAMVALAGDPGSGEVVGIDPARVDQLLGDVPGGVLPVALCLAALIVIAGLVSVAIVAGSVAVGSATLAPPFLSRQPCIVVLAMVPALLGGVGVWLGRR